MLAYKPTQTKEGFFLFSVSTCFLIALLLDASTYGFFVRLNTTYTIVTKMPERHFLFYATKL